MKLDIGADQADRWRKGLRHKKLRRRWFYLAKVVAGIAVIVGLLAFQIYPALVDCNASYNSRQRFLINLLKDGERWFCSTADAAGWRKAGH